MNTYDTEIIGYKGDYWDSRGVDINTNLTK